MKIITATAILLISTCSASEVQAVTIKTVLVGNAGNPANSTGVGSVGYEYRIGKFEITNGQYVEFLNAVAVTDTHFLSFARGSDERDGIIRSGQNGFFSYTVKEGREENPVAAVRYWDVLRFANWLHNGKPTGLQDNTTTEDGAYTFDVIFPNAITRNFGAKWFVPNLDEWYKAAYHKNDGISANYWEYPTASDTEPDSDQPPGSDAPDQSNTANIQKDDGLLNNYNDGFAVSGTNDSDVNQNFVTDVGAYTASSSPYGTFDQGGNVWEWNEQIPGERDAPMRGGSWTVFREDDLAASSPHINLWHSSRVYNVGFRIASIIPEPTTLLLAALASVGLLVMKPRKQALSL